MPTDRCPHCPGSHTGARPCLASATEKTRGWLLIEHPGPWAGQLEETALAAPVRKALSRAREHSVRVQLIRRPGRRRTTPPVQVYVGWSGDSAWLEGRELADPAELNDLDLGAVGGGTRPGFGVPVPNLFLVCANGKHNVCCARLGAPLARALRDRLGDAVWETTHLGGDRYAANLVCLPHGLYYGNLALADGFVVAERYLRGEIWLEHYRGRAGLASAAQAAEHFLRAHTGTPAVDSVAIESVRDDAAAVGPGQSDAAAVGPGQSDAAAVGPGQSDGVPEVMAAVGGERYLVRVERVRSAPCGPECTENADTYVLKELVRA